MKTRKILLVLVMVTILTLAFVTPALAAEQPFNLPLKPSVSSLFAEWHSEGSDKNPVPGFDPLMLFNANRLVVECEELADGQEFAIVFCGPGDNWGWHDNELTGTYADGKYTWNLKPFRDLYEQGTGNGESGLFALRGTWWAPWDGGDYDGITKITLYYDWYEGAPVIVASPTGVASFITLAFGALLVSGGGAAALLRRIKK